MSDLMDKYDRQIAERARTAAAGKLPRGEQVVQRALRDALAGGDMTTEEWQAAQAWLEGRAT